MKNFKMRTVLVLMTIVLVAATSISCCCVPSYEQELQKATSTYTPTETTLPTSTVKPTRIPTITPGGPTTTPTSSPTITPTPTDTPTPTITSTPTDTPEPTVDPVIEEYFLELDVLMLVRRGNLLDLQTALELYANDGTLYYYEDWQQSFEYAVLDWYDTSSAIYGLDAPQVLQEMHEEIKTAMLYEDESQNRFLVWLDAGIPSPTVLSQATSFLKQSGTYIDNATRIRGELGY